MKESISKFVAVSVALAVVLAFFFIGGFGELSSYLPFQKDSGAMLQDAGGTFGEENQGLSNEPIPAVAEAISALSAFLGIDAQSISVAFVGQETWQNGCLGLPEQGEICAQVVTPGYVIILNVDGEEYTYRSDASGSVLRLDTGILFEASF